MNVVEREWEWERSSRFGVEKRDECQLVAKFDMRRRKDDG
jgi:hypothetical protein